MESSILDILLKNGALGILAGVFLYLYLKERKANLEATKNFLAMQKDTVKAQLQLSHDLADLTKAVDSIDRHARDDRAELKNLVEQTATERCKDVLASLAEHERTQDQERKAQRDFRIREEALREGTNPGIRIPDRRRE